MKRDWDREVLAAEAAADAEHLTQPSGPGDEYTWRDAARRIPWHTAQEGRALVTALRSRAEVVGGYSASGLRLAARLIEELVEDDE